MSALLFYSYVPGSCGQKMEDIEKLESNLRLAFGAEFAEPPMRKKKSRNGRDILLYLFLIPSADIYLRIHSPCHFRIPHRFQFQHSLIPQN